MPTLSKPSPIAGPFAYNGDKSAIPDASASPGAASYQQGFPPITQLPVTAGGVPPQRSDFNGILNALSQHIFWLQSGGMYDWSAALDYAVPAMVAGADGTMYFARQLSGPNTAAGAKNPTDTQNADYWQALDFSGLPPVDDATIRVDNGKLRAIPYELCEFYFFRHPTLRTGFQPAQGGLLANAATLYPEAWAYLQTVEGRKLCKTESEWQAMTTAIWHTNADGTKVGWNGIGGAPFYAPNTATGALRLPDLRGMYAEAAGFDALGVGGVHGDGVRPITGSFIGFDFGGDSASWWRGAFDIITQGSFLGGIGETLTHEVVTSFDSTRVVPPANKVQPRAWGALACVYLGTPR